MKLLFVLIVCAYLIVQMTNCDLVECNEKIAECLRKASEKDVKDTKEVFINKLYMIFNVYSI
jgi:hypothetical protein